MTSKIPLVKWIAPSEIGIFTNERDPQVILPKRTVRVQAFGDPFERLTETTRCIVM